MKILILGGTGLLGSDCRKLLAEEHEVIAPPKNELDIVKWDTVIEKIEILSPQLILNCAAFSDVDACEKEEALIRKINVEGPRNLAQVSARFGCGMIHISSDYVFDGQKQIPQPYFEDDLPSPLSIYGKSKMESETAVRENSPNFMIIRTGWLYGLHGRDFIKKILRSALGDKQKKLKMAVDQAGSPTWTGRLAMQIKKLIDSNGRGTYHSTSEGFCTRAEYARHIFKKLGVRVSIEECGLEDFKGSAIRPRNCILENRILKTQGINIMPHWKEDLDRFLDEYGGKLLREAKNTG